jgi:F-type H+-transporting ATPase subunit b
MEETLHALGGLLLKALPTFLLVVVIHFYLKRVFYKPLDKVLQARGEATEGARKLADGGRTRAAQLSAEYEAAMGSARSELYREQDEMRRRRGQEQATAITEARSRAQMMVKEARAQLAVDVAEAKKTLAGETDRLAGEIADSILQWRRN